MSSQLLFAIEAHAIDTNGCDHGDRYDVYAADCTEAARVAAALFRNEYAQGDWAVYAELIASITPPAPTPADPELRADLMNAIMAMSSRYAQARVAAAEQDALCVKFSREGRHAEADLANWLSQKYYRTFARRYRALARLAALATA